MSKAAADTLEKVSSEFEGAALADLQEGRDQALELIELTKRETVDALTRILQTGTKQAESMKRQIIGAAELNVRNAQLEAMEEAVNGAVDDAIHDIPKVPSDRYEKCIARLIREGVDAIGPKVTVSCNSKDREVVASVMGKLSKGKVTLTMGERALDTIGGVVLAVSDGSVRFDNTFEARLERMRPALRKEVAALLSS